MEKNEAVARLQRKRISLERQAMELMSTITHLTYEINRHPGLPQPVGRDQHVRMLQNRESELASVKKMIEETITQLNALN